MSFASKILRPPGNGGVEESGSSLSVPLPQKGCLRNDEDCYVSCEEGYYRTHKKARATDYEADFLRQEMSKLSIGDYDASERVVLGNDISDSKILERGNGETEEPAFVSIKFREFDSAIKTIEVQVERFGFGWKDSDFSAYKLARDQNKAFVDNPQFKIGFLRAERYDPMEAAYRMLRYFKEKLNLFGSEKLTSNICLEDLGEDGRGYLEVGGVQILPKRDEAGRLVVCLGDSLKAELVEGMRQGIEKAIFYTLTCLQEDTEVGKIKGFVTVIWRVHRIKAPNLGIANSVMNFWTSIPSKLSAIHLCRPITTFDMKNLNDYSKILLPAIKNSRIIRIFRSHYGTAQECKYTLMKYGCPDLPIQEGINYDPNTDRPFQIQYQKEWISKRMQIESAQNPPVRLNAVDENFHDDDDDDDDCSIEKILNDLERQGSSFLSDHSFSSVPSSTMNGYTVHTEEPSLPSGSDNSP